MRGRRSLMLAKGLCVVFALWLASPATAERLATRRFTTADGLAGDYIIGMMRDSRGFLWFSTRDGLSRFDGVRVVSYGLADGLPSTTVNHVLETRAGVYWVSTNGGGFCRFVPAGLTQPHRTRPNYFVTYRVSDDPGANRINTSFEDRSGRIWLGTDVGVFVMTEVNGQPTFTAVGVPSGTGEATSMGTATFAEDDEGSLWIGGSMGLTRRLADGRMIAYRFANATTRDAVDAILVGRNGRLWVGHRSGLLELDAAPAASLGPEAAPPVRTLLRSDRRGSSVSDVLPLGDRMRWYTRANGLPDDIISALYLREDGLLWIGTSRGLAEFDGQTFRRIGPEQGIPDTHISRIVADTAGSIWLSSVAGATRVIRNGLVTYDRADGLPSTRIHSITEDARGQLFVVSGSYEVSRFDGHAFVAARPNLPTTAVCSWMSQCALLDRADAWWLSTTMGLFRWRPSSDHGDLANSSPTVIDNRPRAVADAGVFSTFEDSSGDIWISTTGGGLLQWQRRPNTWHEFSEADGFPPLRRSRNRATAILDDAHGGRWFGFEQGGVARWRHGQVDRVAGLDDAAALGAVSALHIDRQGRLWIGTTQAGLRRVDDLTAAQPVLQSFTAEQGLSSNNVRCLTEDERGWIYVGTSRGVDRIDPASGAVRHFSASEGLASEFVTSAWRDRLGWLWFGTVSGLSRLDPAADVRPVATTSPAVFIATVRAGDARQQLSELGELAPADLVLTPDGNQLEIGFFGFSFDASEPLKYQYRLEGAGGDWSTPSEFRSVNYARLAAGTYRFVVRAVRSGGVAGGTPAVLRFRVMPPIYARWWFITISLAVAAAAALALYRARVAQLLRVERVRARIATDLHDDIGASLSQIAILAEVAQQRLSRESLDPAAREPLARIAETSRGLVDAMSDIVWAINPEVDTLSDLVHRMRRFVEDTLGASDIELQIQAVEPAHDVKLGADIRREVFLILKESVTNVAKHAHATRATVSFESDRRHLRLRVWDNGRGFDAGAATDGNGVASMKRRVKALGGQLRIETAPGRGTEIQLDLDLHGRRTAASPPEPVTRTP